MFEAIKLIRNCLLLAFIITLVAVAFGSNVTINYANESIQTLITIFGLYIAAITFFLGNLLSIENDNKCTFFEKVRKELFDSVKAMAIGFAVNVFTIIFLGEDCMSSCHFEPCNYIASAVSLAILFLFLYLVYDAIKAMVRLRIY